MGLITQHYCDGCGKDVGNANIGPDVVQITAIGTDGRPAIMVLCTDMEPPPPPPEPGTPIDPDAPVKHLKIRGCARKVLTKSVLGKLYEEVSEYVGGDTPKPFAL